MREERGARAELPGLRARLNEIWGARGWRRARGSPGARRAHTPRGLVSTGESQGPGTTAADARQGFVNERGRFCAVGGDAGRARREGTRVEPVVCRYSWAGRILHEAQSREPRHWAEPQGREGASRAKGLVQREVPRISPTWKGRGRGGGGDVYLIGTDVGCFLKRRRKDGFNSAVPVSSKCHEIEEGFVVLSASKLFILRAA